MLPSTTVTSPSRFARIPRFVHYPKWGPLVSHDVPFKDGHNGEITITITAKTPLMVGRARDKSQEPGIVLPFCSPDGSYAIPGSALQGLMRSILTVATFGKLGPAVHNRRYAVRDIGGSETGKAIYARRVTRGTGRSDREAIEPLAKAAWLFKDKGRIVLVPCAGYARVTFEDIAHHKFPDDPSQRRKLEEFLARTRPNEPRDESRDAPARYHALIGSSPRFSDLQVKITDRGEIVSGRHGRHSDLWIKSRPCDLQGTVAGTIVITGKPSTGNEANRGKKHREFVFFGPDRESVSSSNTSSMEVPRDVWRDFLLIHEPESGSGEKINPNWAFWKKEFKEGRPVPVFYLEEFGEVKAMGTAQMFKLAMSLSTHDMLANSSPEHVSTYDGDARSDGQTGKLDLPSLIFGSTGGKRGDWFRHNLKRRASFDLARVDDRTVKSARPDRIGPVPLLSPKPSYYPIYVRQPQQGNRRQHPDRACYATYTGLPDAGQELAVPELSGVKIWPASGSIREGVVRDTPKSVLSLLDAVPAGTSFTTRLRVHNLREAELGALLWALTFGRAEAFAADGVVSLRHRLGGAKPYGLGEVEIRISAINLDRNDGEPVKAGPSIIDHFIRYMDAINEVSPQSWVNSNQVKSLIKAATVNDYSGADALEYIRGSRTGDSAKRHADLRGSRDNGGHFLPAYVDNGWEKPRPPRPAAKNHRGGQPGHAPRQAPPATSWPIEEDAPVRHSDGREGVIREVMRGACKVSVNGLIEVWAQGSFVVTGPADE